MILVDVLSHTPYQPSKNNSKLDEELLVANLSRIPLDSKSLQKEKSLSIFHFNKFYQDNIPDTQTHTTKQPVHDDQILNIDSAPTASPTQNLNPPAKQNTTHKLSTKFSSHSQIILAQEVCLLHNFLTLAQRHYISNLIRFYHSNFNRNHSPQVLFTQNQLALAQQNFS